VVDVQGVNDFYTDPQIHTVKGWDYGKGTALLSFIPFLGRALLNTLPIYRQFGYNRFFLFSGNASLQHNM